MVVSSKEVVSGREVVWHDLECGSYRADLPLWRDLAEQEEGPILDVGAGTGRVTLDLARAGHQVTALDLDPELLGALQERAGEHGQGSDRDGAANREPAAGRGETVDRAPAARRGETVDRERPGERASVGGRERAADRDELADRGEVADRVETVCADARSFELDRRDFGLCLVPMQTLQLLRGTAERGAFLSCARAHLRPGGLLACAIVTELEPFDCAADDTGPSAESRWIGETRYVSRAMRVSVGDRTVEIERTRRIVGPGVDAETDRTRRVQSSGIDAETDRTRRVESSGIDPEIERNLVELDRVGVSQLEEEARAVGLRPVPAREIRATSEHVASIVVMARA